VDAVEAIRARRTHKQFGAGPVDDGTLRELLALATLAPNHHLTEPWRFRVLGPEVRARIDVAVGAKEAAKLRRAPTLVLVTVLPSEDAAEAREDRDATAAAVQTLLLAATARGLASYWRTPQSFRDEDVRALLGLDPREQVVALVHLGPPASEPPAKARGPLEAVVRVLP
jgi:nitroreductase